MALKFTMKEIALNNKLLPHFIAMVISILLLSSSAKAQNLELGIFGGGSYYVGEMNLGTPFVETQPAFGVSARYSKNSRWSYRLSYTRGKVQGSEAITGDVGSGLNFETSINDFALVAEFSFWEYFTGSKNNFYSPYIFAGLGFFTFNPKSTDGVDLQPLGTEGQNIGFDGRSPYKKWSVSIPFGIGFKYSLSKRVGLNLEWSLRKTFTDYVDDVSKTYYRDGTTINPDVSAEIYSDPTMNHQPYMERGDEKNFDWVSYAGVTISYKFDLYSKKRCDNLKW